MTKTAGDLLREARNKKGLALQTIERSTGIATHNLLAIELDQFGLIDEDKLEQYLRTYAQAVDVAYESLGLSTLGTPQATDFPPVEAPVPDMPAPVPASAPVSSFDDLVKPEAAEAAPKPMPSPSLRRSGRTDHAEKPAKKKGGLAPMLTLAGLAALIAVAFTFFKDDIAGLLSSKSKTEPSTEVSTVASSETPVAEEPAPAPTTQLAVTGGGDAIEVAVTTDQKPVKIELSLSGEGQSWVGLSNSDLGEGGTTLSSEQPVYTATVTDGATQAILYLGITQGVTIKVNDQVLDMSAITSTANSAITFNIQ